MVLRLVRLAPAESPPRSPIEDDLLPLVEQSLAGDRIALRTLLTLLGPMFLRIVRRVLGASHPEVEDVVQQCAIELVAAMPRFRRDARFRHFACRVAVQTTMNARRRLGAEKRAMPPGECIEPDVAAMHAPDPEMRALSRAQLAVVREFSDALPPVQMEAFVLHFLLGYTTHEVAAIAGVPLETVRSRLRVAKTNIIERAKADPRLSDCFEEIR